MSDEESEEDFSSYQAVSLAAEYLTNISITINQLYALSFRIRNPRMRTGLSRALAYTEVDRETGVDLIAEYYQWDLRHITELFQVWNGMAQEDHFLIQRLAKANTNRRKQFKYWKNRKVKYEYYHKAALTHQTTGSTQLKMGGVHLSREMIGVDMPRPSEPSTATHLDPANIPDGETVTSIESYVVTDDEAFEDLMIPPPPTAYLTRKEFECPYCFIMCARQTLETRAWRRHIMRDLRPYICTFGFCKDPDQQYASLTEWVAHESSSHGVLPDAPQKCPFCHHQNASTAHIASHLRRIACFSLPRGRGDTDARQSGMGSTTSINMSPESQRDSVCSTVYDEWSTNTKLVVFRLDENWEIALEITSHQSPEELAVACLQASLDLADQTVFRFLDQNGNQIPLDYDSLYNGMVIFVEPEEPAMTGASQSSSSATGKYVGAYGSSGPTSFLSDGKSLHPSYKVQDKDYFRVGKVFKVLWHEIGHHRYSAHGNIGPGYSEKFLREPVYITLRIMVVVKVRDNHSLCFAAGTYQGRGLAKPGIDPSTHAIMHITNTVPMPSPQEPPMVKEPIKLTPERHDESLDPMTRLNFGKIYTVEHRAKILPLGEISAASMEKFIQYAREELSL